MSDIVKIENIQEKIFTIRGVQVMLDRDLAKLYQVETRRINEQVKRNIERFPDDFMFQLNEEEFKILKSHFATSSWECKKWFTFSKMDKDSLKILEKLKEAKRLENE